MIGTVQYVACLFQLDWLGSWTFKTNVCRLPADLVRDYSTCMPTQDEPRSCGNSSVHAVIFVLIPITGSNRTTVTSSLTTVLVNLG
jgi:hypothetical protein